MCTYLEQRGQILRFRKLGEVSRSAHTLFQRSGGLKLGHGREVPEERGAAHRGLRCW